MLTAEILFFSKNTQNALIAALAFACLFPPVFGQTSNKPATVKTTADTHQQKTAQADSPSGNWKSEWGPVSIKKDSGTTFSGSWEEGKSKIGKIHSGNFDPKTRLFEFDFTETWTGLKGRAKLKLSDDNSTLAGSWIRGKDKGEWKMQRGR